MSSKASLSKPNSEKKGSSQQGHQKPSNDSGKKHVHMENDSAKRQKKVDVQGPSNKAKLEPKYIEFDDSSDEGKPAKKPSLSVPSIQSTQNGNNKAPVTSSSSLSSSKSSSLLDKYRKKLDGAKFRLLNESLYTGQKADLGLTDKEFEIYHQGFASQVSKWPTNPVNVIIDKYLKPRNKRKLDVGDFGCGDAKIAARQSKFHNIHSFDLVAANQSVVACDIARDGVPLGDDTLDMVIFSLSLMGEEVSPYIKEARRVLRTGGFVVIAEVKSRFSDDGETSSEGMEKGLKRFCSGLSKMGFKLLEMDAESNTMFVLFRFQKQKGPYKDGVSILMKSCEYKRR